MRMTDIKVGEEYALRGGLRAKAVAKGVSFLRNGKSRTGVTVELLSGARVAETINVPSIHVSALWQEHVLAREERRRQLDMVQSLEDEAEQLLERTNEVLAAAGVEVIDSKVSSDGWGPQRCNFGGDLNLSEAGLRRLIALLGAAPDTTPAVEQAAAESALGSVLASLA
jgi:hypothetical protein